MDEVETIADDVKTKAPRVRTDQDQLKANYTGEIERQIAAIRQSSEVAALVAARGLTGEKLEIGQEKVLAFQATVNAKQQGLGSLQRSSLALKEAFAGAKLKVSDLRESVRIAYPKDKAAQQALGATEKVPGDQEKFLSYARTCGNAAKQAPYAAALDEVGFDSAAYDTALEAFANARATFTVAELGSKQTTVERDVAFQDVKDRAQPFRRMIKLALKARPDLLTPLGL
jgi:chromosome segregation ATPase